MPAASFHAPLGTWSEATPTFTSHTANLTILGGDFVPDNEVQGSSGAVCSSIFALKFGMSIGLMGWP